MSKRRTMFNWQSFLDAIINGPKYKLKYERCSGNYAECSSNLKVIGSRLIEAENTIRQLELLLPRPAPPELENAIEKDSAWVDGVLVKMEAIVIRLPLGNEFRLTDKDTFLDWVAWDWVDSFEYHKFYRCGNFAISLKADADQWGVNQVGIVLDYQSGHAYNIVIFPDGKVMLLEPQSDNLFCWQEHAPQFYNLEGAVVII